MGDIAISYGNGFSNGLLDAKKTAGKVADKLEDYEDNLRRDVYNKLSAYRGDVTENITSALNSIRAKQTQLSEDAGKFNDYATALGDLKEQCQQVDGQVARRVNSLCAEFKNAYAISTCPPIDALNNLLTAAKNKFKWLRKASEILDTSRLLCDNLLDRLRTFYDYKGGREFNEGVKDALFAIGITVASLVAICATGGLAISVIAAIGAGIAIANSLIDIGNEYRAFYANAIEGDPARARRLHNENTASETLMKEATSDIAKTERVANTIDGIKNICDTITAVYSIGKLGSAALKWGGGSGSLLSKVKAVGVKSFDNAKSILATCKHESLRVTLFRSSKYICKDFLSNLQSNYCYTYDSFLEDEKNLKYTALCVKNVLSTTNDLRKGEFKVSDFLLSNFTSFRTNVDSVGVAHEWKTMSDITGIRDKIEKVGTLLINRGGTVTIKAPDIHIPEINMNIPAFV